MLFAPHLDPSRFLAKREGGFRPIALISVIARLHGRVRRPLVRQWQRDHPRPYWWSNAGRSSSKLVWVQAACSELAASRGFSSGLILLDRQQVFEHVRHDEPVHAARQSGFPPAN